ncbi:hypothetical protein [Clostridium sp. CCUG 7971]|uniref:hypothetical protein n=1 Tax=Clostridium sp. CCUG 7971 TaxID=2811414 RepID=UPI001ABA935F|nr:hypothetical protein [Clostridium sp. CCUG 7971]MBO3444224.1 hypothetical protein [Clostridium sp. CCUG 7971]
MKLENKFIAAGLGLAISFTGTYFSHSWFTDNASQGNTISIGKLVEDIVSGNVDVRFGCLHDNDHDEITINMKNIIEGKIKDFTIISGTGNFENVKKEEFNDTKIVIEKKHGNFNNIGNNFSDDQMVIIKIIREVGTGNKNKIYEDIYKFQFKIGNGNKLECLYTLIKSNEISNLIEDEEINNENQGPEEDAVLPPESGEEVNPSLPGGNIKPVAPPSDEAGPSDEEDKPSTEEKPSEPETNKPSTEEGTQKPEQEPPKGEKPEVVEPPKPEPQPDTPTTIPLD